MQQSHWTTKLIFLLIASFLGIIASRPFFEPMPAVQAQAVRFDHVTILATTFIYKGRPGLLLLDRRNGISGTFRSRTTFSRTRSSSFDAVREAGSGATMKCCTRA